ncbi:biotin/lipoyl-containing protein [Microbacterium lacticum]
MTPTIAAGELVLPNLGESVNQATVTRWLKDVGDPVAEGEPIDEVATDKVDSEIVAPITGIVSAIHVTDNEVAERGQALATITPEGAAAHAPLPTASAPSTAPAAVAPTPAPLTSAAPQPVAPGAAPASLVGAARHSTSDRVEKLSHIRRVIADRMMHSLQSTAQLTSVVEIDVTRVAERRAALKAVGRPTPLLSFFARAALDAVRAHPKIQPLRGWYVKDAVSGPEGAENTARRTLDGATMTGKTNVFRSAFVDGANGMIRDRIGSDQHDLGFSFDWIVVDFRPNTPLRWDPHFGQLLDPARPPTFTTAGPKGVRNELVTGSV